MLSEVIRVLLVEDDQADALLARRSLSQCQTRFEIDHVSSLGDAMIYLEEETWDVVLLDLTLEDSHILEGVKRLRSTFPELPVVVLTNLDDPEIAVEAIEFGVQDYLIKGMSSSEALERSIHYAVQRQQVSFENQRLMGELERISRRDPLTGMLNRYHFSQELAREWNRFRRSDRVMSCVILDVDFFKRVNDLHGHGTGDEVLKALAHRLRDLCRESDVLARYGGEEFVVILPDTDEDTAANWAEDVKDAIAAKPIAFSNGKIPLTISCGVASSRQEMEDSDELIDQADQALLVAKQTGRNQVVRFSHLMNLQENGRADRVDRFQGILVRDLMSPIVAPLLESQSLITAVRFMLMLRLESIPVVDDEGKLVGLITEEDLISRALTSDGWTGPIGDAMSQRPVSFDEDVPARVVCDFLGRISLRRVVIVRDQHPVGIVSRSAILRWQRNHFIADAPRDTAAVPGEGEVSIELRTVITELVAEVADLQSRILDDHQPAGPLLITKASRMQEMLDELLGLTPAGHGGDLSTGTLGHLMS